MKEKELEKFRRIFLIFIVVLLIGSFLWPILTGSAKSSRKSEKNYSENKIDETTYTVYDCDVKHLKLSTTIEIEKDGKDWGKVKGNIFKIVEDPLTLYDVEDNKIAYAGDTYKFVGQDNHGLYLNNEFKYDMVGKFDVWGETYELYNANEEMVAKAEFNKSNTNGKLYDAKNNIIATYESSILFDDFSVQIENACNIEHEIVIMLFASYYSDYSYDNNN